MSGWGRPNHARIGGLRLNWLLPLLLGLVVGSGSSLAMVTGVLVVLCLVAVYLYDAELLVLAYIASRPLVDAVVFVRVGSFTLGQLWGAGLLVLAFLYALQLTATNRLKLSRTWAASAAFVVAYGIAVFRWSMDVAAWSSVLRVVAWIAVVFLVYQVSSTAIGRDRLRRMTRVMALLVVVVIAAAVIGNSYGAAYYEPGARSGTNQGPHGLSMLAVLVVGLTLVVTRMRLTPVEWFLVAALSVGVVASLVRTSIIALALMVLPMLLIGVHFRMRQRWAAVAVVLTGLVGGWRLFRDALVVRFGEFRALGLGGELAPSFGSGRLGIWAAVISSIASSPGTLLFGIGGLGSRGITQSTLGVTVWAHNDFLEVLVTGGLVLALAYIGLIASLWFPVWTMRRSGRCSPLAPIQSAQYAVVVLAFVFMSLANGIIFYQASLVMAALFGYACGASEASDVPQCSSTALSSELSGRFASGRLGLDERGE